MKTICLALFLAGVAFPQCGKLVINPVTHKPDCAGSGAAGAAGAPGTGFNGAGTFAQMNASTPSANNVWELTDATNPGYCGAGSGTAKAVCVYTGSVWVPASGMISGGSSGQVPYQSAAGVTSFTPGIAFSSTGNLLGLTGGYTAGQSGGASGITCFNGFTSGRVCVSVAAVAGTEITYLWPATNGTAGQILSDSGAATCPTLPAGLPATCHQLAFIAAAAGSVAQRSTVSASATPTFAVTSGTAAYMVLTPTTNVTSSTLTVASGNPFISLTVCQGATPRTVVLPTNVFNAPSAVDARAHYCTVMSGNYDGSNLIVDHAEIRKDDGTAIPGEITIAQASGANATTITPLAGAGNRTVVIPGSANSAVPLAYSCGAGNHAVSFDASTGITTCAADSGTGGSSVIPTILGTAITLSAPNGDAHCTGTCAVDLPVPAAGRNFCIYDNNGITAAITINNPGSGTMFGKADRTGYGNPTSGTLVSTGGTNSQICLKGIDATHYSVVSSTGTWTNSATVAFTGLGDVLGGAFFYTGLRAYSAATKGTKAAQVCNAGDANCVDINSDATTGDLDMVTVQAPPLNCLTGTCTVRTLYDQTGSNNCTNGSPQPCDMFMTTEAVRPKLTFSCSGGKPCLRFDRTAHQVMCSGNSWTPMTGYTSMASVAKRASTGAFGNILANYDGANQIGFGSDGTAFAYFGASISGTYTEGNLVAFGGVFTSGAGVIYLNGSSVVSGNMGTNAISGNPCIGGVNNVTNWLTGDIMEVATWNSNATSSQAGFSTNQRAYWGF